MVDYVGIGATGSRAPAKEAVRRHAGGGEGSALPVLEANRPDRAASAAESDARRALHPELAEAGGSTEPARRGAEYTHETAVCDEADSPKVTPVRGIIFFDVSGREKDLSCLLLGRLLL